MKYDSDTFSPHTDGLSPKAYAGLECKFCGSSRLQKSNTNLHCLDCSVYYSNPNEIDDDSLDEKIKDIANAYAEANKIDSPNSSPLGRRPTIECSNDDDENFITKNAVFPPKRVSKKSNPTPRSKNPKK